MHNTLKQKQKKKILYIKLWKHNSKLQIAKPK